MADNRELENLLKQDVAGLTTQDAEALSRAVARDLARRKASDPEAETRRRVSQMSDFEFDRWRREQMR